MRELVEETNEVISQLEETCKIGKFEFFENLSDSHLLSGPDFPTRQNMRRGDDSIQNSFRSTDGGDDGPKVSLSYRNSGLILIDVIEETENGLKGGGYPPPLYPEIVQRSFLCLLRFIALLITVG